MTWREWLGRQVPDPETAAAWFVHALTQTFVYLGVTAALMVFAWSLDADSDKALNAANVIFGIWLARILWWRAK